MLALRSGAQLGNYELVRAIGSGGMGVVYEARHEALGRRVAIKVLHALAPETPQASVVRERFAREGRAAALVRHAHIVDVFDFGVHDGTPFLVMELVDGESLAERLAREGTLPLVVAVGLILPVLSAVAELHGAGIIHRDLKPGNVLLGRGRNGEACPKVADFGVSRADDDSPGLTASGVVVGTYAYMPPEQARASKTATEHADQYAIGAILYECVTGRAPFQGESPYDLTHAILHERLAPPSERNAYLPSALDAVILRALSREPEARFGCVEDFAAALLPFAEPDVAARWADEFVPSAEEPRPTAARQAFPRGGPFRRSRRHPPTRAASRARGGALPPPSSVCRRSDARAPSSPPSRSATEPRPTPAPPRALPRPSRSARPCLRG